MHSTCSGCTDSLQTGVIAPQQGPPRKNRLERKRRYTFRTFSFKSLNWLHDLFYPPAQQEEKTIKRVPTLVKQLLTERALAVWIMDDGGKSGDGLKISTEGFSLQDNRVLQSALGERFLIEPTIQRHAGKHLLYFKKKDYERVSRLVRPYTLPCMYYKLFDKEW